MPPESINGEKVENSQLLDAARLAYPPTPLEQLIDEIYADDTDNS